jgi:hypothetical protein
MDNIIMLSISGHYPIIAKVIKETEEEITVHYPIIIYRDNPHVYTTQYMPFAVDGEVVFKKHHIVCTAKVQDKIEEYYNQSVEFYKSLKPSNFEMVNPKTEEKEEEESSVEKEVEAIVELFTQRKSVH